MKKQKKTSKENERFFKLVEQGMRLAAMQARETARMYGTPIVIWKDGKIVTKKP